MNKKKYMDRIDDYLRQQLGGTFWISAMPVLTDYFPVSLWDRFLMFLGLKDEYFPVRIDWSYRGKHYNTVYTGPADKDSLEPLAAQLYRAYLKQEGRE